MNKLVKGAIAGAAGIALLLGGAGTLALWNDSATIAAPGTINAGTLTIAATAPATDGWQTASGTAVDLSTYRVVPGDTLKYVKTFTVTATGNTLSATVALGALAITAATTGDTIANGNLAAYLTKTAAFTVDGVTTTTISGKTGTQTVVVTATMVFPKSTTAGFENNTKNGVVNLANFTIALTQV